MRNDIVSSLALKRMCCILLRTWTEQWLNIRRHIGTKSTTSEARKMKEQTRWKEEKRKLTACENRRKRTCLIFRSLGGVPLAEDFEPDIFGIPRLETVDCETLHMFTSKTDKGCLRDLCRANCFAREAHWGDCLGILHMRAEWTYNCLIEQYLSTNGLFETNYVFSWIWPCNGY